MVLDIHRKEEIGFYFVLLQLPFVDYFHFHDSKSCIVVSCLCSAPRALDGC